MRCSTILLGVSGLSFVLLSACGPQAGQQPEPVVDGPTGAEADVAAITRVNVELIEAFNAGDVSAAVALVMDDAVDLPPQRPAVIGKEAIREFLQSDVDQFTMDFADEIVEVEVAGDLAVVWTNYTVTLAPKGGGEPIKSKGKWLKVLKRQSDGSWKFSRNIWNSDIPPPERPAS
jgi:uncharacterized protein (TIGR02246 family)